MNARPILPLILTTGLAVLVSCEAQPADDSTFAAGVERLAVNGRFHFVQTEISTLGDRPAGEQLEIATESVGTGFVYVLEPDGQRSSAAVIVDGGRLGATFTHRVRTDGELLLFVSSTEPVQARIEVIDDEAETSARQTIVVQFQDDFLARALFDAARDDESYRTFLRGVESDVRAGIIERLRDIYDVAAIDITTSGQSAGEDFSVLRYCSRRVRSDRFATGLFADDIFTAELIDVCLDDDDKLLPGACGCGNSDLDSDADGAADCVDACPFDPDKTIAGVCSCGVADTDTDEDGLADCIDPFPTAPTTTDQVQSCDEPGQSADTDGDGTPDCRDGCPLDSNKTVSGTCGCGLADVDSDSDNSADCVDACPNDAEKSASAVACGCNVADVDTDGDGFLDCEDVCPFNGNKPFDSTRNILTGVGVCGCERLDTDLDGNGVFDCLEGENALDEPVSTCGFELVFGGVVPSAMAADVQSAGEDICSLVLDDSELDPGNRNPRDQAVVYAGSFRLTGNCGPGLTINSVNNMINALSATGAHEIGHLLGLTHVALDGLMARAPFVSVQRPLFLQRSQILNFQDQSQVLTNVIQDPDVYLERIFDTTSGGQRGQAPR